MRTLQPKPKCACEKHTWCSCEGQACRLCAHDPRHGTANGYTNLNCRCEPCCADHSRKLNGYKANRIVRGCPPHLHGTSGGYGNWGCRCVPCTGAWTEECADRVYRRHRGETDVAQGNGRVPKLRVESDSPRWTGGS